MHAREHFDHELDAQTWPQVALSSRKGWEESQSLASTFTKPAKSKGLLWAGGHVYRSRISGLQKNEDTIGQAVKMG